MRSEELGIAEGTDLSKEENTAWVKSDEKLVMVTNLLGVCIFSTQSFAVKGKTWAESIYELTK